MPYRPSDRLLSVVVTREELGVLLEALDIRTSQWGAMANLDDPCIERYELDEGEADEMHSFYERIGKSIAERNQHLL